ncbi:MAG: DUF3786 domain-containing protein [Thermodesulfovibrionales bacterium]
MIAIYKKLPGTNCGQCGLPTCIAFALKVKKSQACLSECPFMGEEKTAEGQLQSGASSFSSYEQVSRELENEAVKVDFRETAGAIGGMYISVDGRETIALKMINTEYELKKEGLFRDDVWCGDLWAKIILCDYVRKRGRKPLTGEWLPLGLFPHTASLVKAFQSNAEKKIAVGFRRDLNGLKQRCASLDGVEARGKIKADYICRFNLLPHVPLYLSFWVADEEFDADCKLLFDSSAEDHIDIEYLAYLIERFAEELLSSG